MNWLSAFLLGLCALCAGCASYQLGSSEELAYSTVHVAPPRNLSALPQIEAPTNTALRKSIEQTGRLRIADSDDADAILELTIANVDRRAVAALPQDVGRGRKIELALEVTFDLRDGRDRSRFLMQEQSFIIRQDIFADSGQIEAERQAVAEIARKIAQATSERLQDRW